MTTQPPARPPKQDENLTFTFVESGVASAVTQSRAAAGDRDVQIVGGPTVIRQALREGLVDEFHLDVLPLLLGSGLRLFVDTDLKQVQLALRDIERQGQRTGLRFSVLR